MVSAVTPHTNFKKKFDQKMRFAKAQAHNNKQPIDIINKMVSAVTSVHHVFQPGITSS